MKGSLLPPPASYPILAEVAEEQMSEEGQVAEEVSMATMMQGAKESHVAEPEDLGQALVLEIQMAEPRNPRQVDAEGVQVA
ncbi:hypothetical protein GUJ93_ZPchr0001g29947 [Zizania palustris]|uniref:Uncharacterized protein n=1 Tax=Zizania palustris TaxID=103762 RepID=A0A8J5RQ06_ZIZPA|nr:hypothetical protein GUJ93_ZPchr0001g29947 [Zizania palustris]